MLDVPIQPPREWFSPPEGGIPTDKRITVEADGRVYGYIALWNTCHAGLSGCTRPPKGSPTDYEYAHQGETLVDDGDLIRTAVIGGGAGHAPVDHNNPVKFYENSGTQLMRVRYGEDNNGLWFAGVLWPDVNDLDVARIRASALSGDWRWHAAWRHTASGGYDFAGSCLVNIPGFPVPTDAAHIGDRSGKMRALAASASTQLFVIEDDAVLAVDDHPAVVAAAIPPHTTEMAEPDTPWDGMMAVELAESDRVKLRQMHAWVDDADNPDAKFSYKLPHHLPDGRVVLNGVKSAMSRLMNSETDVPADERRRVYEHLAAHYVQFGLEPPEFHVAASAAEGAEMCECQNTKTDTSEEELVAKITASVIREIKASVVVEEEVVASAEETDSDSEAAPSPEERISNLEAIVRDLVDDYIVRKIDSEFDENS